MLTIDLELPDGPAVCKIGLPTLDGWQLLVDELQGPEMFDRIVTIFTLGQRARADGEALHIMDEQNLGKALIQAIMPLTPRLLKLCLRVLVRPPAPEHAAVLVGESDANPFILSESAVAGADLDTVMDVVAVLEADGKFRRLWERGKNMLQPLWQKWLQGRKAPAPQPDSSGSPPPPSPDSSPPTCAPQPDGRSRTAGEPTA